MTCEHPETTTAQSGIRVCAVCGTPLPYAAYLDSTPAEGLITWLRAQVDEDERIALAAIADDCDQDGGFEDASWLDDGSWRPRFGEAAADMIRMVAVPRRILAEVDAKRRRLALHSPEPGQHPDFCGHDLHQMPCPTIRLDALPYTDRPGYRPEWRPA